MDDRTRKPEAISDQRSAISHEVELEERELLIASAMQAGAATEREIAAIASLPRSTVHWLLGRMYDKGAVSHRCSRRRAWKLIAQIAQTSCTH